MHFDEEWVVILDEKGAKSSCWQTSFVDVAVSFPADKFSYTAYSCIAPFLLFFQDFLLAILKLFKDLVTLKIYGKDWAVMRMAMNQWVKMPQFYVLCHCNTIEIELFDSIGQWWKEMLIKSSVITLFPCSIILLAVSNFVADTLNKHFLQGMEFDGQVNTLIGVFDGQVLL